jgi:hypothetical protein
VVQCAHGNAGEIRQLLDGVHVFTHHAMDHKL